MTTRFRDIGRLTAACVFLFAALPFGRAAEPTYWQDIRPVLRKHCTVCHNVRNLRDAELSGRLALDSYEAIHKGGKTKVVIPGDGAGSLLVSILRHPRKERRMPLDAPVLPDETVAQLKSWIDSGAKEGARPADPDTGTAPTVARPTRKLNVILPTKLQNPPKFELVLPIGPLAPVAAVAYSPDGRFLAVGTYGLVTIWDSTLGQPIRSITGILGSVNDLKFSPDGRVLAVAGGQPSARGDLRLFDLANGQLLVAFGEHADVVSCIAFSADGKTLASTSFDKAVRLWDVTTRQLKHTFAGHSDFVYSVAFSPIGDWLVTASKDRTVRLIQTQTGLSQLTFSGMDNEVLAVAVSPDGTQVVSSGYESSLFWWNSKTGELARRQGGHAIATHELAFDRSGKVLASAGADKTVRLWNGASGAAIRSIPTPSVVYAVAIRADGGQIAAGCADGLVRIFDAASARQLLTLAHLPATTANVEWLALTPEGFVAGSDATLAKSRWQCATKLPAIETIWPLLKKPVQVTAAWRGDKLTEPVLPQGR